MKFCCMSADSLEVSSARSSVTNAKGAAAAGSAEAPRPRASTGAAPVDEPPPTEPWYSTLVQVAMPFFLAGVGTIGAGVILSKVQDTEVFTHINALLILVSSLLGLKGNLDMCLASRLSTLANVGEMNDSRRIFKMVYGNISLVQVQAIVAAIFVSIFAVSVQAILHGEFEFTHAVILCVSSLTTATSSCFFLDLVLIGVILLAHRYKVNPDNLATPLAASIGDVVSLTLLYTFSSSFYNIHGIIDF